MIASTPTESGGSGLAPDPIRAAALQLSAIGDPVRLAIVTLLGQGTACACVLQEQLGIAPNLLSYHLRVLREAGIVAGVRRGRWIDYSLVPGALQRLRAAIPVSSEEEDLPPP